MTLLEADGVTPQWYKNIVEEKWHRPPKGTMYDSASIGPWISHVLIKVCSCRVDKVSDTEFWTSAILSHVSDTHTHLLRMHARANDIGAHDWQVREPHSVESNSRLHDDRFCVPMRQGSMCSRGTSRPPSSSARGKLFFCSSNFHPYSSRLCYLQYRRMHRVA